jgi:uncharacterized membrane protein YheB (UPF0754 family)
MDNYLYLMIPLLTALSALMTVWLIFIFCFHPRKPRRILGLTMQGIFPKMKEQLPVQLSELLGRELDLGFASNQFGNPESLKPILPLIENHIDDFLRNKLAIDIPMVGMFVGDKTIGLLKQSFLREMESLFPEVMQQYASVLKEKSNLKETIRQRLNQASERFEQKLQNRLRKDFKSIALLVGLAGLFFGALLSAVLWLIR